MKAAGEAALTGEAPTKAGEGEKKGRASARLDAPAATAPLARLPWIDVARGVALVAMAVYHFSWDLAFFGFTDARVDSSLGWIIFARSIAGSFLALVGVSLVLAHRSGIRPRPFAKRLAMVAVAAGAITLVTYFMFPDAYIFFGILHQIALASLLGLFFLRLPVAVVAAAAVFFLLGAHLFAGEAFNSRYLEFLGLMTYRPVSNDFVPVFPWFGMVLVGMVIGRLVVASRAACAVLAKPVRDPVSQALAFGGRHSLAFYLIHQPLLFGCVYAAAWVIYR